VGSRTSLLLKLAILGLLTMSTEVKRNQSDKTSASYNEEKVAEVKHVDLNNNVQARLVLDKLPKTVVFNVLHRIQNPLHGISKTDLLERVEKFTEEKGLKDRLDIFKKGALLAQNQRDFESIPELTEEDKEVIRRETTRMICLRSQSCSQLTDMLSARSLESVARSLSNSRHL